VANKKMHEKDSAQIFQDLVPLKSSEKSRQKMTIVEWQNQPAFRSVASRAISTEIWVAKITC
jgi:hypothetical protein